MIRKSLIMAAVLSLAAALSYAQEGAKTTKITGYIIDNMCATEHGADAKDHGTACALMPGCRKSGFRIVVEDKSYTLDERGNTLASEVLNRTQTKKGLRVEAEGTLEGETLHVSKLAEAK